ncbi:TldD/PmbA family protein [Acidipila sp. EB88]|uniref:TldD/PmbA family protein n=1 Tax=Acidipila sp. EB88 TaxID=2305226 RepID=UPI000F60449F|nr:metallopeptidase TldD-related protein [Acidipila sp. EB88]RRA47639.1 TldD/PmbA family protein [Acidipila sp. EB88]
MATATKSIPAYAAQLAEQAESIVAQAVRAGATDAEVVVREGDEFDAQVRMGELETLKDSGSRGMGLRVFLASPEGQRVGSTSSSDFTPDGIAHLVAGAIALARISSPDPVQGLPEPGAFGTLEAELELYHQDVYSLPDTERIEYARRVEAAALAADPRITNSDGGSFSAATNLRVLANSRGFVGASRSSYCGLYAAPIATGANGEMQRDGWSSSARTMAKLESPEQVGAEAARRTIRRLDGRRVSTQRVPIVFPPEMARSILGAMADAANGDAIYRGASFFTGKLGEQVAARGVTVINDGTLPGLFGSSNFDGEGLPTRRTVLIEDGILRSWLLNTYTGRKLNLPSTGSASRGLAGNPGISTHNLYLPAGTQTPEQILAEIPNGLYVTEFLGRGINMVTGDYSRGASGIWIENGQLAYPVQEFTIAGNLKEIFMNITAIGNDLEFRSSTACPTLRIDGLTIAGS